MPARARVRTRMRAHTHTCVHVLSGGCAQLNELERVCEPVGIAVPRPPRCSRTAVAATARTSESAVGALAGARMDVAKCAAPQLSVGLAVSPDSEQGLLEKE